MWKWCKSIVDVAFFFLHFWQLGCYNSFFFPPIFNNLVATIHIFLSPRPYNFGNLVATIVLFQPPSLGRTRISIISLPKFNFLSPLTHWVRLDWAYFCWHWNWNWKHCSKIIFKYVNSIVGPIFKEKVAEKWNLWIREQCTNALFTVDLVKMCS